jgi:hypothetical protein
MGGTMMACVPDLELERKFLAMFPLVARWQISGETLLLLDADGKTLATFESRYFEAVARQRYSRITRHFEQSLDVPSVH